MSIEVLAVELVEAFRFRLFLSVELNDPDCGDALLEERVDPGEPRANGSVGFAHSRAEEVRRECDSRNHHVSNEGESPVHDEHGGADCNQSEDVPEGGDESCCEELVQRFDVSRHPGDEAAGGIPVEERNRETLEMREDFEA